MRKITIILTILILTFHLSIAQKVVSHNDQQWLQYYNQLEFSEKLSLFNDINLRRIYNFSEWSQITFRTAIAYSLMENLHAATGLAYFTFYDDDKLSRTEYRPFQDVSTAQLFHWFSLQHRYRLEARYFKNKPGTFSAPSNFNFRFRYRILCEIPLKKLFENNPDSKIYLNIGNEIFINAGNEIIYNMIDNNRLMVGTTYQIEDNLGMSFNYTYQFGQSNNPAEYKHADIFSLAVTHNVVL